MLKLKNSEIIGLISNPNGGLKKLVTHGNLDGDKAYDLSLLVPELEKQAKVIEENRIRIAKKFFPAGDDGKQSGILENKGGVLYNSKGEKASKEEIEVYGNNNNKFTEEYNKILEKEIELEGDKITLSREKGDDGKSELNKLNLTAVDLMELKPLIDIK